jgi:hypothetical protein
VTVDPSVTAALEQAVAADRVHAGDPVPVGGGIVLFALAAKAESVHRRNRFRLSAATRTMLRDQRRARAYRWLRRRRPTASSWRPPGWRRGAVGPDLHSTA